MERSNLRPPFMVEPMPELDFVEEELEPVLLLLEEEGVEGVEEGDPDLRSAASPGLCSGRGRR